MRPPFHFLLSFPSFPLGSSPYDSVHKNTYNGNVNDHGTVDSSNYYAQNGGTDTGVGKRRGPPGFIQTDTDITIQEGQHAFFSCKVQNLVNETVS